MNPPRPIYVNERLCFNFKSKRAAPNVVSGESPDCKWVIVQFGQQYAVTITEDLYATSRVIQPFHVPHAILRVEYFSIALPAETAFSVILLCSSVFVLAFGVRG